MGNLIRDLRYGARSLLRDPGFAITVLLTLSLCIAANTASFAILNSVVLHPLPGPNADQILLMANRYPGAGLGDRYTSSGGDFYDRLKSVTALKEQALFRFADLTLDNNGRPRQVHGMAVTPSFFSLVEVSPVHGRTFTAEEGEIGDEQKVVLSDALWRALYGADPSAIGYALRIGGRPYTIVGVMPQAFDFVEPEVQFWVPLALTAEWKAGHHNNNWYHIGRLMPGATIAQVQAQVDAVNASNLERFPQLKDVLINAGFRTVVEPLQHMIVKEVERTLYLLWGGAIFVLLIGALNLINVALARLTIRRKEIATRLALGCDKTQLLRQFLVENILIAGIAGIAVVGLGAALLRALTAFGLDHYARATEVHVDTTVVLIVLGMSVAVGAFMGSVPLVGVIKSSLASVLLEGGRTGTGGVRMRRLRQVLVGAEIGFAFVLLAGAGLLLASFRNLLTADTGFTSGGVLTASTNAPQSTYPSDQALTILMNRALDSIRRLPGVASAGATTTIPFGGNYNDAAIAAEGYVLKPGESLISPHHLAVTPGYFETMKIPLMKGRYFDDHDSASSLPVVIVDERLAHHFWPNGNPIGQRMYQPNGATNPTGPERNTRWLKVVGVVNSVRLEDLAGTGSPVGVYYFPYAQSPERGYTFVIKAVGDMHAIEPALSRELTRINPDLAVFDVRTMLNRAELSVSSRRVSMSLAVGFGMVALFLAAIGIYGVLAYLITQRTREIGIRMALGSTAAGVVNLVLREGLLLVATGLALGVGGTVALRKTVASQIYGVRPLDPWVMGSVVVFLGFVAMVACLAPARRAVRIDPVRVLNGQ